jgi:2-oxoglutarate ferredoxin oxidoreductase subunit beta
MVTVKDYLCQVKPTWCPGCGNFGIWNSLKAALANLSIAPHEVLIVSGIGCGSKLPDFTRVNGFQTLHGRPLAVATGAHLANHQLKVIVVHGDGDGFSMGGNHFLHAIRRNVDLVEICQDNRVYGLTKGQYSPTSPHGFVSKTSPTGSAEQPFNPIAVALAAGATFVSRGFAGDMPHLTWLIEQAVQHPGYSLVEIFQPCVSFNKINTYQWYQEHIYKLEDEPDWTQNNLPAAFARSLEWGNKIPIGIFFRNTTQPTLESQIAALKPGTLVQQSLELSDIEDLKAEFV